MWLLISAIAALVATYAWLKRPGQDRLSMLSLAFWGLTVCIFVDHTIGWVIDGSEGPYFEVSADALCLSAAMIIVVLAAWELALLIDRLKASRADVRAVQGAESMEE